MHVISIVFVVYMWWLLRVNAVLTTSSSLARLLNLLLCYTTTSTSRAIVLTIIIIGLRLIGSSILLTTPSPTSLTLVPTITLFGRAGLDLTLLTVNDDMSSLSGDGCKEPKSIRLNNNHTAMD